MAACALRRVPPLPAMAQLCIINTIHKQGIDRMTQAIVFKATKRAGLLLGIMCAMPATAAEQKYALSGFDRVSVAGSDNVVITAGPAFAVVASGTERVLARLAISVKDGALLVGRKPGSDWGGDNAVVKVTMPALHGLNVTGSADVRADRANGASLDVSVAGSGNAKVDAVQAAQVRVQVSGSGDVNLAGRCTSLSVRVAGSGNAMLDKLACADANIAVAGSGGVNARATGTATVAASGSGDIMVTGGARCTKSVTGSADVICR
jgi:hypothetical protein